MELKLKDEDKLEELNQNKQDEMFQGINDEFLKNADLPVIKTQSTYTGPTSKGHGGFIIKMVLLAAFLGLAAFLIFGVFLKKPKELMSCVNMTTEELEKELDIKLTRNDTTIKRVRHYSNGNITTDGNGEIAVLYNNGKQFGIHVDSKKYCLYNVHFGDAKYDAEKKMTYHNTYSFSVMNDMYNGTSTSYFYTNKAANDCLVITCNDNTNRVVAITYFNDLAAATERLNFE
ncbi:hypothetical protein SAMN04487934_102189 [Eubacterium ruminantium]|nr:hypothetical protein SAMN04487934_102189 [Eubacterium ruminantium]